MLQIQMQTFIDGFSISLLVIFKARSSKSIQYRLLTPIDVVSFVFINGQTTTTLLLLLSLSHYLIFDLTLILRRRRRRRSNIIATLGSVGC